ncbi:MAG: hypothetical protein QOE51_1253 [Actinoplanes sp.]|jgi:hypothetical protein|nr:hypothetical protein [Actinoplanes sp.]
MPLASGGRRGAGCRCAADQWRRMAALLDRCCFGPYSARALMIF